jgi:hypothetical protein
VGGRGQIRYTYTALTLNTLTGSLSTPENVVNGFDVGTISGYTSGSTKSLSDNAGGRFQINSSTGAVTVADSSLLNYENNTSHNITIVETLSGAGGSPKSTTLSVAVTDRPQPPATTWSGSDPVVNNDIAQFTTIGSTNKPVSSSIGEVGGTGAGFLILASEGGFWVVQTSSAPPLTNGSYTLILDDSSQGISGTEEYRSGDTLNFTVQTPPASAPWGYGQIIY